MARVYRIARAQGRWKVTRDGELLATAERPEEAVEIAEQHARTDIPSRVVLHDEAGAVQREWGHDGEADVPTDDPDALPGDGSTGPAASP